MNRNDEFSIRTYGKQELALKYFPNVTPDAALRRLRRWIMLNPTLRLQLAPKGRLSPLRAFTPREVRLIVEQLGEP